MRTIIAGSRTIRNYETVERAIKLSGFEITSVLSGCANGPDTLGERWAKENDVHVEYYPANWNKDGGYAGLIRNRQMADNADAVIAVWDGKSTGTKDMIDVARRKKLSIHVHVKGSFDDLF